LAILEVRRILEAHWREVQDRYAVRKPLKVE
jgi:hypothetical protein